MCGRYVSVTSDADLAAEFEIDEVLDQSPGRSWNVAPTDPVRLIVQRAPHEAPEPRSGDQGRAIRQLRTASVALPRALSNTVAVTRLKIVHCHVMRCSRCGTNSPRSRYITD